MWSWPPQYCKYMADTMAEPPDLLSDRGDLLVSSDCSGSPDEHCLGGLPGPKAEGDGKRKGRIEHEKK